MKTLILLALLGAAGQTPPRAASREIRTKAVADAVASTTGAIAAGSHTFTDNKLAPFTAASVGKLIVIPGAGAGSAPALGSMNILSVASGTGSLANDAVIAFQPVFGNTTGVATGNAIYVQRVVEGKGLKSQFYFLRVLSPTTAALYADAALTSAIPFAGNARAEGVQWGPIGFTTRIAAVADARTVTLQDAAPSAYTGGAAYRFGTDNGPTLTAELAALASSSAAKGPQRLRIPAGSYLVAAPEAPLGAIFTPANCGFAQTSGSDIAIIGDGAGRTNIYRAGVGGPVACVIGARGGSFQGITLEDAVPPGIRYGYQNSSFGLALENVAPSPRGPWSGSDIAVGHVIEGYAMFDGCLQCVISDSSVHDYLANGSVLYASSTRPVKASGFVRLTGTNGADALLSGGALAGFGAYADGNFCRSCSMTRGGAVGVEILGGNNWRISDFHGRDLFGALIRIVGGTGFDNTRGVSFSGECERCSNAAGFYRGSGQDAVAACVEVAILDNDHTISDVSLSSLKLTGGCSGPFVAAGFLNPSVTRGRINNLSLGTAIFDGPQTAPSGQGTKKTNWTRNAAIEIDNTSGISIGQVRFAAAYADGVYLGASNSGPCKVGSVMGTKVNSSARPDAYGVYSAIPCTVGAARFASGKVLSRTQQGTR